MTTHTLAPSESQHVDAYRTTGTSPGPAGRVRVRLRTDHGGWGDHEVAYEVHGPAHAPTTAVLGGISADRHLVDDAVQPARGWWPGVVGSGAALDPERHRLVGIDWLSSGAHPITTHDQARAVAAVLDELRVQRATLVGASYGGMVALAFAALFPTRADALVVLCAAHRSHPLATALRAIQRRIVRFSAEHGRPALGLSLGRALAMTTYRSAVEFDARFDGRPLAGVGAPRFPVEEYLDARGAAFAERFDPERFECLSASIDLHTVEPSAIRAPTTLVSFDTDALVPPWLVDELAERAPGVRRRVSLSTIFGHDAFLKEVEAVSAAIATALSEESR